MPGLSFRMQEGAGMARFARFEAKDGRPVWLASR